MKAMLKAFDCVDHDPIDEWRPKDSDAVDYWLCLHIGPSEKEGADLFYVQVLSATAAESAVAPAKKIVVSEYSWVTVKASVEEILRAAEGDDWHSVAKKLSESFDWEFDGYEEFQKRA